MHISFGTRLNYFQPMLHLSSPRNQRKNLFFRMFSRSTRVEHWLKLFYTIIKTIRFHYLRYHATHQRLRKRYLPAKAFSMFWLFKLNKFIINLPSMVKWSIFEWKTFYSIFFTTISSAK